MTGGQDTVALRVPAAPLALALLREFDGGIAAPSANRFGKVSPTTADHVRTDLGDDVDLVLDGGRCQIGMESTIVDLTKSSPGILRPGGIAKEELERVLGCPVSLVERPEIRAPGTLPTHYAPHAKVVLAEIEQLEETARREQAKSSRVAALAPEGASLPEGVALFSVPRDAAAFARVLYSTLREIDRQGFELIVAALPAPSGLGLAIRDRLTRAAGQHANSGDLAPDSARE